MFELIKSDSFDRWLDGLRDGRARARIEARIRRLSLGNPGDVKSVGDGIPSCALITVPAIGSISSGAARW
jgi:putative addiction module killer protein